MILGGIAIQAAFTNQWSAFRNGERMTKDELFDAIGPNSFDVTLGSAIMRQTAKTSLATSKHKDNDSERYIPESMGQFYLNPGHFILGVTQERFDTDTAIYVSDGVDRHAMKFVQKYDGRSTIGRLGIASHVTAGFGDYGFKDYWTLELVNLGNQPVILHAGMRIGQISFEQVYEPLKYEGAYVDVSKMPKPKAPKLGKDRF
jgi:dCTP deaminase